eukprot:6078920-Amphidinium_carterae.1
MSGGLGLGAVPTLPYEQARLGSTFREAATELDGCWRHGHPHEQLANPGGLMGACLDNLGTEVARDAGQGDATVDYNLDVLASSSRATSDSLCNNWVVLHEATKFGQEVLPLTLEGIHAVATVVKAGVNIKKCQEEHSKRHWSGKAGCTSYAGIVKWTLPTSNTDSKDSRPLGGCACGPSQGAAFGVVG